jgi:hypothetical protein
VIKNEIKLEVYLAMVKKELGIGFLIFALFLLCSSTCKVKDSRILDKIIKSDSLLSNIHENNNLYEVQVRYTQIDRDANGKPTFKNIDYNVDPYKYFYPASTAKMPTAILALQKIKALAKETGKPIDIYTSMENIAMRPPQDDYVVDILSRKAPTIADYVDQIFCVSDNNAHNRLFEFLGAKYINEELYRIGAFKTSHIVHRLGISGFTPEDNEYINEIRFLDQNRKLLHKIEDRRSVFNRTVALKGELKGIGYSDAQDKLINKPFDFSKKNYISIIDLEACMQRVLFPEAFPKEQQFNLEKEDYAFLKRSMSLIPRKIPYYASNKEYYDNYVKFFYHGDKKVEIPDHIKIYNKVGFAYGTLTDVSYFVDEKNNVEFMLTATILVNKDGVFNDGKYEYDEIGQPFFARLGKHVYDYELKRKK